MFHTTQAGLKLISIEDDLGFISLFIYLFIYLMYVSTLLLSSDTPEEGIRSATMWLLGIELGTSGRAVGALNH